MNTALRLATFFVFTSQALAFGGAQFICRYTGQVMESDCCPTEKVGTSPSAKVEADSCCEIRKTERAAVTAVVQDGRGKLGACVGVPDVAFAAVQAAPTSLVFWRKVRDADPPSGVRLHLKLRHLLV